MPSGDERQHAARVAWEGGTRTPEVLEELGLGALAARDWDAAVERWRQLPSDEGATYDETFSVDVASLEPMLTYGTNPGQGVGVSQPVPDPAAFTRRLSGLMAKGLGG